MHKKKNYLLIKRILDIVAAYILLILSYLTMIIIAISIKAEDGGPVIFRQIRVGQNEKRFVCYKFRTMKTSAPSNLSTSEFIDSAEYITRVGAFLRKTSLDELPQLFNVLSGDMSIIGPRPLIPNEREICRIRKAYGVYSVRPGITGLAQICGRDRLNDVRKAECDAIYVENVSFSTDIRILLRTILRVLDKDGNYDKEKTVT